MSTAIMPVATKIADPAEVRRQRGLAIAAVTRIEEKKSGLWHVPSQTGTGAYWARLDLEQPTCTCKDFEQRSQPCKHAFAVRFAEQRESRPDGTEVITEIGIVPNRPNSPFGSLTLGADASLWFCSFHDTSAPKSRRRSVKLANGRLGRSPEIMTVVKQTVVKKPPYKQDWSAYNKAQTTEKTRLQAILYDLCRDIPEPPSPEFQGA